MGNREFSVSAKKLKNNIINDILHSIYIKVLLATVFRYSRQSVVHHGRGCLIAIDAIFLSTKDLFHVL